MQLPKGDISYLQKFFSMYVGGRLYLHSQEYFCGTALLSTEWLQTDLRRAAIGLDLDPEALNWCTESNINKNVPFSWECLATYRRQNNKVLAKKLRRNISLRENRDGLESGGSESTLQEDSSSSQDENLLLARPLCVLLTRGVVVSINVLNWLCISSMLLMPCQRKVGYL
ncbi:hypothetical protein DVH24_039062 [Malus domestica]|uniref:Uncharacterized protein n=1 Tax=Malus domestica TaxID=3750 RepID=A0A498KBC1_MALDO|nr:hypothetical protein DVH24_039062 [Malus domestica]